MDFPFAFLIFFCSLRHSHSQNFFSPLRFRKCTKGKIKIKFSLRGGGKFLRLIARVLVKTFPIFYFHFELVWLFNSFRLFSLFAFFSPDQKITFLSTFEGNLFFTRQKTENFASTRSNGSMKTENVLALVFLSWKRFRQIPFFFFSLFYAFWGKMFVVSFLAVWLTACGFHALHFNFNDNN